MWMRGCHDDGSTDPRRSRRSLAVAPCSSPTHERATSFLLLHFPAGLVYTISTMRQVASFITALIAYATVANAHARVTSPPIRTPGPNHLATCGQSSFNRLKLDETGHIEEQQPITQGKGCELTLCRGMLFSDQPASNIQRVTPGQPMAMAVDCTIPHGGPANVSLIDTTVGGSGRIIGSFLKTFSDFCPTSGQTPADQTNLQFNLPALSVVGNNCQKDGDCVVQLFWATPDFSQNYYYCESFRFRSLHSAERFHRCRCHDESFGSGASCDHSGAAGRCSEPVRSPDAGNDAATGRSAGACDPDSRPEPAYRPEPACHPEPARRAKPARCGEHTCRRPGSGRDHSHAARRSGAARRRRTRCWRCRGSRCGR
ncbi:hypothetical protein EXIGLDRAFT_70675 [Exidia glandulosa HHB12029]|uniref:Chitin-binding type-4 domain-containing protein n=1 Tax=Exidia glandulosa HHB12029 TaxID=1314781 RepID=A0A165HXT9_EXIGL|nr:hypothetical protein EXIGLDRAFT_70675 [Exidia glandulosa HHB12029]